jgi:transposase
MHRVIELYLRAWNNYECIAQTFNIDPKTVGNIVNSWKKVQMQETPKDFKPYLYNIWNLQKQAR